MKHTLRNIIGSAFIFATLFNSQLTWNAAKFTAPMQETVKYNGQNYSINSQYNDHLVQNYTDKKTNEFFIHSHGANVKELSKFFKVVK